MSYNKRRHSKTFFRSQLTQVTSIRDLQTQEIANLRLQLAQKDTLIGRLQTNINQPQASTTASENTREIVTAGDVLANRIMTPKLEGKLARELDRVFKKI